LENRLRFALTVVAGDDYQRDVARFLQRQWRRIGVIVQLRLVSYGKMSGIRSGNTDYEAVLLIDPLPHHIDQFSRWHSSEIGEGLGKFTRLRDPRSTTSWKTFACRLRAAPQVATRPGTAIRSAHDLQPCFHIALRDTARVFHKDRVEVIDKSRPGKTESAPRWNRPAFAYRRPCLVGGTAHPETKPAP